MTRNPAAFAIPGDITTLTGGYIYERRLLEGLRALGHDVAHLQLAASFPDPSPGQMTDAIDTLKALPSDQPVILDGLVCGAIDTGGLSQVKAPIVAMIHHPLALETGLEPNRRDYLYKTERDNLALAAHVLVPSPHTATILNTQYGVPIDRITIAQPGKNQMGGIRRPVDPPLILSVGIQHPRKGHDVLLRALEQLRDLNWNAVIVGSAHDPDHADDLRRTVDGRALGQHVRLAGRIPQPELAALYGAASIFALATRYEGYGIVFDEALCWGLPIVSCDAGAVAQTVPPGAGVLVPPDDPDAFAAALRDVLLDAERRTLMAAASAQAASALPSWADTANVASEVLRRVIQMRRA